MLGVTNLINRSPNVLALNFGTSAVIAMGILLVIMTVATIVLYFWWRATSICCKLSTVEGLQSPNQFPHRWRLVLMSFILTVIYLPLSTMAMHVLVWSDDLWVVPNPYINATTTPVVLPPLGPSDEFRGPLDFCWTTTMKRNDLNYAPVLVILALVALGGVSPDGIGFLTPAHQLQLTVWFPIHLYKVIKLVYPKVDPYTELGTRRSTSDMDREYQRLLDRDTNPLQFLYHGRSFPFVESLAIAYEICRLPKRLGDL